MPNYKHLQELCNAQSEISAAVVDKFLLYYAAKIYKLDKEFDTRMSRFKHALASMPANSHGLFKAQYIAHRIFKTDGLLHKILNHSALKDLDAVQQDYLQQAADRPWRFSFSTILANPAKGFYEMEDVFTGETYLLYSNSINQILSTQGVLLWFNLIGYNGHCWQTYGPVTAFQSFDADDIFFYATELSEKIASEDDLIYDLENNPVPYMMLVIGSTYPLIQNGGYEILHVISETTDPCPNFDMQALKKDFKIEYAEGVFKLSHQTWSESPHFGEAYYQEKNDVMYLSALTERGYMEMAAKLKAHKYTLGEPSIHLHLPMVTVIKDLLKRDLEMNPYSQHFEIKPSLENESEIRKINYFLSLALPYINAGNEPDIQALAKEAGVDVKTARELLQHATERMKKLF